ncbi:MAG: SpoIIE family protein phosphatase [Actinocrinis sp.]
MQAAKPPPGSPMLSREQARGLVDGLLAGGVGAAKLLPSVLDDYLVTRAILDGSGAGIAVVDPNLRYLYVNDALAEMNGVPPEQHLGRTLPEVLPDLDFASMEKVLKSVLLTGRPQFATVAGRTPADPSAETRWWINAYHRLDDSAGAVIGLVAVIVEITETYRAKTLLDEARTRLALLDEAATRIGTTLDVEHTCKELARLLVPRIADIVAVDVLDVEGAPGVLPARGDLRMRRLALTTTAKMSKAAKCFGAAGTVLTPQASAAVARCLTEQRPVISNVPSDQMLAAEAPDGERVALYRKLGMHSAIFVPLTARRDLVGAVILVRAGESPQFSQDDVDLVTDLARRAATSINHAKRFAHEHQTALVMQQALLSTPRPPHPTVQCASRYLPTGADIEIGGDWYDTVALPGGKTLLVVGDVMGHGFEAASAMSEYRALLRTLALQSEAPERILAEAQRIADGLDFERAATCVVAVVDPEAGKAGKAGKGDGAGSVCFANAGHMPPLLLRPNGESTLIDLPVGPPIGVGPLATAPGRGHRDGDGPEDGNYQRATIPFEPGATLLFYTDGLVERRGKDIDECINALTKLTLNPKKPLDQLVDSVLARFVPHGAEDDVAILAARLQRGEIVPESISVDVDTGASTCTGDGAFNQKHDHGNVNMPSHPHSSSG